MSSTLHTASRDVAYLEEITVLVPRSWNLDLENITLGEAEKESFNLAHIRVDRMNPSYHNRPYSFSLDPRCGEPWLYTHITPDFILNMDGLGARQAGTPLHLHLECTCI